MTLALAIPTLETERLVLRAPSPDDFDAVAAFYADADRSSGFGGPMPRDQAWRWMAGNIGHWALRGYGFWAVEEKATGKICGLCGLWFPEGWPEPELGWAMFDGAEGRGLAAEAARRARAHAYEDLGLTTLTSLIVPGNTRSVALAERLGATYERTFTNLRMGQEMLYRHPAPEALQ